MEVNERSFELEVKGNEAEEMVRGGEVCYCAGGSEGGEGCGRYLP